MADNREMLIRPGRASAAEVAAGQVVRITDVDGQQVSDFIAFSGPGWQERLSTAETVAFSRGSARIGKGTVLYSSLRRPLLEVTADTVGVHDATYGSCSPEFYAFYLGDPGHPSCRAAFAEALRLHGIGDAEMPAPVNFFQDTRADADGTIVYSPAAGRAGDYVELRALQDCLIAATACPCDISHGSVPSVNGAAPTPILLSLLP